MSEAKSALETQVGGNHYKGLKIQPVEYIHANGIGFAEGSAIKYLSRWRDKGGVEDLKKARHFIDILIELEAQATIAEVERLEQLEVAAYCPPDVDDSITPEKPLIDEYEDIPFSAKKLPLESQELLQDMREQEQVAIQKALPAYRGNGVLV